MLMLLSEYTLIIRYLLFALLLLLNVIVEMHVELVQEGQAVAEPQPTLMIIAQYIVLADFTDQVELLQ